MSGNMWGELTDWQVDSGDSASYLLDLAGNIDTKTAGAVNTSYGYNGDLMTSAGSAVVDWDNNGQITAKGATTYDWDFSGRLKSVDGPAKWLECRYGPDKTPVWQLTGLNGETSGQYKRFVYDTNGSYPVLLLVLSEDGTGEANQAERYFWVNGQNIAVQVLTPDGRDLPGATGELYYNIHDRLGSIRQVIDSNLTIVNRFDYDPYGKTTLEDFAVGCDYESYHRFAGYKWEDAAGMYNCNARWYDPELMRFISRDPVRGKFRDPLSLHRYLYCLNNPANMIDPDGRLAILDTLSTNATLARIGATTATIGRGLLGEVRNMVNALNFFAKVGEEMLAVGSIDGYIASSRMLSAVAARGTAELSYLGGAITSLEISVANGLQLHSNSRAILDCVTFMAGAGSDPDLPTTAPGATLSIFESLYEYYYDEDFQSQIVGEEFYK